MPETSWKIRKWGLRRNFFGTIVGEKGPMPATKNF